MTEALLRFTYLGTNLCVISYAGATSNIDGHSEVHAGAVSVIHHQHISTSDKEIFSIHRYSIIS